MASRSPLVSPTPLQYKDWVIPAGVSVPVPHRKSVKLTWIIFHIDSNRHDNDERVTQPRRLPVATYL